jgi:cobalt/nickel transport system ATP-binding protein
MSVIDSSSFAISLTDVRFEYPDQKLAIDGLNLQVSTNEKVAFIGPNAAGKSTLIMLLNGVLKGEGDIQIFGTKVTKKSDKKIKAKIGIVFQNPDDQLFCPTVYEDVAFGPLNFGFSKAEINSRVKRALTEVGLSDYESRSSLNLSYGEKKLVSIATVLSTNPDIIALDEPTSNLDPFHRRKIIDWIKKSNKTVLIATHDLDMVAETVQRVIILRKGRIRGDGNVKDILTDKRLLEENFLELPLSLQVFPISE